MQRSSTFIPAEALNKDTYLVIHLYGVELYSHETKIGQSMTGALVDDLIGGSEKPFRVIRFNPVEKTCSDVTNDLCLKLADYYKEQGIEMPDGFATTCDAEKVEYFTEKTWLDDEGEGRRDYVSQHRLSFADYGLRRRDYA